MKILCDATSASAECLAIERRVARTAGDNLQQLRYAGTFENVSGNFLAISRMADRVWYFALGGNRQGPISEDDLHAIVANLRVRHLLLFHHPDPVDPALADGVVRHPVPVEREGLSFFSRHCERSPRNDARYTTLTLRGAPIAHSSAARSQFARLAAAS